MLFYMGWSGKTYIRRWHWIGSERLRHVFYKRKNFSGLENSRCKGPEMGTYSAYSRNDKQANVVGVG